MRHMTITPWGATQTNSHFFAVNRVCIHDAGRPLCPNPTLPLDSKYVNTENNVRNVKGIFKSWSIGNSQKPPSYALSKDRRSHSFEPRQLFISCIGPERRETGLLFVLAWVNISARPSAEDSFSHLNQLRRWFRPKLNYHVCESRKPPAIWFPEVKQNPMDFVTNYHIIQSKHRDNSHHNDAGPAPTSHFIRSSWNLMF